MNGARVYFNFTDGGVLILYDPKGITVTEGEHNYHVVSGDASVSRIDTYVAKANVVFYKYLEGETSYPEESE